MANIARTPQTSPPARTLSEWDPFRLMREMLHWDPFREVTGMRSPEAPALSFFPHVDVAESKEAYTFKLDLPGVKESDLEVSVTGNRLSIRGKRHSEHEENEGTYHARERSYGSFARMFLLPDGSDLGHLRAELKDGVLTVVVPKGAEHEQRRIPINAGAKSKS